jgi:hypothetical protein
LRARFACKPYGEISPARHSSGASSPRPGRFTAQGAEAGEIGQYRDCHKLQVFECGWLQVVRERATVCPEIFFGFEVSSDLSLPLLWKVKMAAVASDHSHILLTVFEAVKTCRNTTRLSSERMPKKNV